MKIKKKSKKLLLYNIQKYILLHIPSHYVQKRTTKENGENVPLIFYVMVNVYFKSLNQHKIVIINSYSNDKNMLKLAKNKKRSTYNPEYIIKIKKNI